MKRFWADINLRFFAVCGALFMSGRIVYNIVDMLLTEGEVALVRLIFIPIFNTSGFGELFWLMFRMNVVNNVNDYSKEVFVSATADLNGPQLYINLALLSCSFLSVALLALFGVSKRFVSSKKYRTVAWISIVTTAFAFFGLFTSSGHVDPFIWLFVAVPAYGLTMPFLIVAPFIFKEKSA